MKHSLIRFSAVVLTIVFVFALTGCGSGSNSFTWFVDSIPANLDPQVASASADVIACENLYSGLVRKDPSGKYEPALCERWEKSSDGLTYTFYLKDGLTYTAAKGNATDYAITAEDFVFAFRRLFRAETNSPYAVEFAALENSAAVLAGQMPESALGVTASGPLTLVFHLSSADDNFLEKLTLPGAMPCDEEFFNSTRGTYGLNASSTLSSGSFYIYNWTASGLFLRRAPSDSLIDSLRLVQNTNSAGQSAAELIANEKCSAAPDDTAAPTTLTSLSYSDTTWSLLFNCSSVFASTELRQALASAARGAAEVPDGGLYAAANGLVPDGLTVDGMNYRDTAGDVTHGAADADHLRLQQGQPDGARRFRRDQRRRGDQWRVAKGVFPLLLRRGGGRGDLCETAGRGGLHHRLGSHQRRGRQCVQHAEPVHRSGRRPDRLYRFPVYHPAAGQHPGHRKLPLPPAGRL